jgi:hypothetical protein
MMHATIASEIWSELRRFVTPVDRTEAADAMVAVLINNDESAEDIRAAFKGDADVKAALLGYLDDAADEEDYEEIEDEDEDW